MSNKQLVEEVVNKLTYYGQWGVASVREYSSGNVIRVLFSSRPERTPEQRSQYQSHDVNVAFDFRTKYHTVTSTGSNKAPLHLQKSLKEIDRQLGFVSAKEYYEDLLDMKLEDTVDITTNVEYNISTSYARVYAFKDSFENIYIDPIDKIMNISFAAANQMAVEGDANVLFYAHVCRTLESKGYNIPEQMEDLGYSIYDYLIWEDMI